jgi:hypothetical protein
MQQKFKLFNRWITMTITIGIWYYGWLAKWDRSVFVRWSSLLLFSCAYFVISGNLYGLASFYLEGCSFLTAGVSTPANRIRNNSVVPCIQCGEISLEEPNKRLRNKIYVIARSTTTMAQQYQSITNILEDTNQTRHDYDSARQRS